jgi:Tfp pilus assembly protein PilN
VEPVVDGAETRFEHVRIYLGRREIRVAEHHLNRAQIGAVLEEMRRERVPEHVRAERARQSGLLPVAFQNLPEADAR